MAAVALSMTSPAPAPPLVASRRVDFHLKKNSFSRWKYRQVDCFIAASDAIARHPARRRHSRPANPDASTKASTWSASHTSSPPTCTRSSIFPHDAPLVGNVGALVAHKGQRHLIDAAALVVREVPDARFVILGEGALRDALEHQIKHLHLERHVFLAGSGRT